MNNKKLFVIIIAVLFALVIAGMIMKMRKTENVETKPAENVLVEEEVSVQTVEDNQVKEEAATDIVKPEEAKGKTTIKLYKKPTPKPVTKSQTNNETVQQASAEKTDINPELLKNEPRSEVVVVDKEYKIRRLGKYIFR